MNRREFLKSAGCTVAAGMVAQAVTLGGTASHALAAVSDRENGIPEKAVKDRLLKSRLFNRCFEDDIFLDAGELPVFGSGLARLKRVQRQVGYANFSLLGFDDILACGRTYSRVGRFSSGEIDFLEKIFSSPAGDYGFMGEKPIARLTATIDPKKVRKIPRTGNYLFRGKPEKMYADIRNHIGRDVVLTSGVRGMAKQFLLFLNKTAASGGNLSMASRSLAPPGYSFHGIGDFDVGKKGFGVDNFTEKFTRTRVYTRLSDLGYIKFRYDRKNELGVRFEPWHVEVG